MLTLSRPGLVLFSGLLSLLLVGCGDQFNRGGEVRGKVTIDGAPVTAGNVLFVSENGKWTGIGPLNSEGIYRIKEPPLGNVKIAVQTEMYRDRPGTSPKPVGKPGTEKVPGSAGMVLPDPSERGLIYKAIPKKYEKTETSELTYTVVSGNQSHDLELTWK